MYAQNIVHVSTKIFLLYNTMVLKIDLFVRYKGEQVQESINVTLQ